MTLSIQELAESINMTLNNGEDAIELISKIDPAAMDWLHGASYAYQAELDNMREEYEDKRSYLEDFYNY